MNILYAMITRHCNLHCRHCNIHSEENDNYNEEKFVNTIKDFNGKVILFGGEPSLHENRVAKVAQYADSISTNLLDISDNFISLCDTLNVATSWNPFRFTWEQEKKWRSNIKRLNAKPTLLITLTPDLIMDESYFRYFRKYFDGLFYDIIFEQLISSDTNEEYFTEVDSWLIKLKRYWDIYMKTYSSTLERKDWIFDCSRVKTLYPDGTTKNGCPQYKGMNVVNKCYSCDYADICRPCINQKLCTCPKQLLKYNKKEP